ncbi:MAG: DUF427 domain-containing protein [Proteobacteria bacterium]|nr:DUF427 domain-containing protein [Pseudomonadota bacterium]
MPRSGDEASAGRLRRQPRRRPERIVPPGPGQESVWDYPRPPRVEPAGRPVRVEFAGRPIAESVRALRVCETAGPPCYYIPAGDVRTEYLHVGASESFCEWKGTARYWTLRHGSLESDDAAWSYPEPFEAFEALRDTYAFYPGRVDACYVGGERVRAQPGAYYGGWITSDVTGPFKGGPGSEDW